MKIMVIISVSFAAGYCLCLARSQAKAALLALVGKAKAALLALFSRAEAKVVTEVVKAEPPEQPEQ
jgi:hypothetical protein